MPVYTFHCIRCDHTEEEFYHMTETLPVICPNCSQKTLQVVIGAPADWFPHSCTFNGKFPLTDFQKVEKQNQSKKYY